MTIIRFIRFSPFSRKLGDPRVCMIVVEVPKMGYALFIPRVIEYMYIRQFGLVAYCTMSNVDRRKVHCLP